MPQKRNSTDVHRNVELSHRLSGAIGRSEKRSASKFCAAIKRRVLTGVVINSNHIDPRLFLEDARNTVFKQLRVNHEKHACLKVNTVFNGEFVAGAQTAVKSIAIRNRQLFPTSDLREWYDRYVIDATMTDLDEIQFPMTLKQISRFERLNDVSVNVFTVWRKKQHENEIVPIRLTDDKKDSHVNLLYLLDLRNNSNVGHFVGIKNLPRLVGSQLNRNRKMKYICDRCLHYFYSSEKLSAHSVDCEKMNDCAIALPNNDDKWLCFRNHKRRIDNDNVKRYAYQHHKAFSVGYYLCSPYDEIAPAYRFRRGEDCVSWFVNELNVITHRAREILMTNVTMAELTLDETRNFLNATSCHICERPFESQDQRVRDHCHLTGRYGGPAHPRCNLFYRDSYVIPVFFHNLSGYDAHFIIKDIANSFEGSIDLLPLTKETYISFTKNVRKGVSRGNFVKLRFVDSFKFLSTSLEKLASYLDRNKLKITLLHITTLYRDILKTQPYMRSHDSSQPSTYLMYLDVNNLYGWAMCEPLPYAEFQWVDDAKSLDIMPV
ncbi:uncharacterized protein LOC143902904 [Temnothorax americanus]|uniref:uncharacterized protein LOC143902904 n=1 Tax=Temnothorax americanus TaxID=1964332 RepID=UPI004068C4EF